MMGALLAQPDIFTSAMAAAFGSYPYIMNARLSPDGSKLSFLLVMTRPFNCFSC
jgi:hypothetical protein